MANLAQERIWIINVVKLVAASRDAINTSFPGQLSGDDKRDHDEIHQTWLSIQEGLIRHTRLLRLCYEDLLAAPTVDLQTSLLRGIDHAPFDTQMSRLRQLRNSCDMLAMTFRRKEQERADFCRNLKQVGAAIAAVAAVVGSIIFIFHVGPKRIGKSGGNLFRALELKRKQDDSANARLVLKNLEDKLNVSEKEIVSRLNDQKFRDGLFDDDVLSYQERRILESTPGYMEDLSAATVVGASAVVLKHEHLVEAFKDAGIEPETENASRGTTHDIVAGTMVFGGLLVGVGTVIPKDARGAAAVNLENRSTRLGQIDSHYVPVYQPGTVRLDIIRDMIALCNTGLSILVA